MRILFVYHHPLSDPSFRACKLPLFECMDHQFDVVCTEADINVEAENVDVVLSREDRSLPSYLARTIGLARRGRYDVVHSLKPGTSLFSYLGARMGGNPFLLDADDYDWTGNPLFRSSARYLLNGRYDGLVMASRRLNELYGGTYLPFSADLDRFDPERNAAAAAELREELGVGERRMVFWAGNFVPEVDVDFIAEFGRSLDDALLLVAGEGERFDEFLERTRGSETVETVGWIEPDEIPTYYAAADAGLIPFPDTEYHRCKCPMKLFEYMASALPVLTTPVGEPDAVVKEAACGIVGDTPEELAESFEALPPGKLDEVGRKGRLFLAEEQTLDTQAEELDRVYREVAGS